jgi:transcriptional regulator with XRE-family HTH domain
MPTVAVMSKRVAHGPAIRAIREATGVSISAFAPRVGVTQGYMSNVELGHKVPTVEFMSRVAQALGVPLDAVSYVLPICDHEVAA